VVATFAILPWALKARVCPVKALEDLVGPAAARTRRATRRLFQSPMIAAETACPLRICDAGLRAAAAGRCASFSAASQGLADLV